MSPDSAFQKQLSNLEWRGRFLRLLTALVYAAVLLFVLFLALPFIKANLSHPWVTLLGKWDHRFAAAVKAHVNTMFHGIDLLRWVFLLFFYFAGQQLNRLMDSNLSAIFDLRYKASYQKWKAELNLPSDSPLLQPLEQSLAQAKLPENASSEELLQLFVETKRRLEAIGRDLAFLAVDVADSTGMKAGEEQEVVMHAFAEYRRYVEGHFARHKVVRATWTPDGVMACFPNVSSAVGAARDLIEGLPKFNRDVQMLRRDFAVRCGVNAGFVYYDPTQPLEHLSDRVLDITGHLQKKARPNTLCVARPAIEPLAEREGFVPAPHTVNGQEVFEWQPAFHSDDTGSNAMVLPASSTMPQSDAQPAP